MPKRRRQVTLCALAGALALVTAACASSVHSAAGAGAAQTGPSGATVSCKGDPVKIVAVTNLSVPQGQPAPEFVQGAVAAGAAATRDCALGRPVSVIQCDDQFNPNDAAGCAREAVQQHAVALTSYGAFGDSIMPILAPAGIPSVGNNGASSSESTSKLSFPAWSGITNMLGAVDLGVSAGAKNIALVALDIPTLDFIIQTAQQHIKSLGGTLTVIRVPPDATDMAPYAGQVLSSGAGAFYTFAGLSQVEGMLVALHQQGADWSKLRPLGNLLTLTPAVAQKLGGQVLNGVLVTGMPWSPTDTSNPAIKQYVSELQAAGEPSDTDHLSTEGVDGWAAVHMVVDALKGQGNLTAQTVVRRLNTPGVVDTAQYGLPSLDYTKPAYPNDPALSKLRLFGPYTSIWRFNSNATPEPLSGTWVNVTQRMKVNLGA